MIIIPETFATFKICVFGEGGSGKTSFTKRYLYNQFDIDTLITLGANIFVKYIDIENKRIALQIWDFGGEAQFRFMLPAYSRGAAGGIFMFDLTRAITLGKIGEWLTIFKQGLSKEEQALPIMLVGAKQDLSEIRSVEADYARNVGKSNGIFEYIECSAKSGYNVQQIFEKLTRRMMMNIKAI